MSTLFDAIGPSSAGQVSTSAATGQTWTHTAGAGGGTVLVFLSIGIASGPFGSTGTLSGVTYGGHAMTQLAVVNADGASGNGGALWVFGITGQAAGANTVLVGTFTPPSGGTFVSFIGYSASFTGGGSFGTPVTNSGSGTGDSVAVSTAGSGSLVAGSFSSGTGSQAITAGTQRWLVNQYGTTAVGATCGATAPGTGSSVTISATWSSDWYAGFGVEVLPASGATPVTQAPSTALQAVKRSAYY